MQVEQEKMKKLEDAEEDDTRSTSSSSKKKKPMACESCYLSRVKCVYSPDPSSGGKCERCVKQNKKCVARAVVRSKGTSEGGSFTRELDLNAYKALEIIEDNPHLTQHYNGASAFVKTYKALGFNTPPDSLKAFIHSLYLIATKDKSVGRLHAATTLAVSTGVEIDMAMLNSKDAPATDQERWMLEQEMHRKYLARGEAGACFMVRHDAGNRDIIATADFEELFISSSSIAGCHVRNSEPHLKVWRPFVMDQKDADAFSSKIIQALIKAEPYSILPNSFKWQIVDSKRVRVKDNQGNVYKATMVEEGCFTKCGFLNYSVFGFKNLDPETEAGAKRLKSIQIPFREATREVGESMAPFLESSGTGRHPSQGYFRIQGGKASTKPPATTPAVSQTPESVPAVKMEPIKPEPNELTKPFQSFPMYDMQQQQTQPPLPNLPNMPSTLYPQPHSQHQQMHAPMFNPTTGHGNVYVSEQNCFVPGPSVPTSGSYCPPMYPSSGAVMPGATGSSMDASRTSSSSSSSSSSGSKPARKPRQPKQPKQPKQIAKGRKSATSTVPSGGWVSGEVLPDSQSPDAGQIPMMAAMPYPMATYEPQQNMMYHPSAQWGMYPMNSGMTPMQPPPVYDHQQQHQPHHQPYYYPQTNVVPAFAPPQPTAKRKSKPDNNKPSKRSK